MSAHRAPQRWSAWCLGFLAICWVTVPGCQFLRGGPTPPVVPETAKAEKPADEMGHLRPPGPKGQQSGLDSRAKEIERNLGVN